MLLLKRYLSVVYCFIGLGRIFLFTFDCQVGLGKIIHPTLALLSSEIQKKLTQIAQIKKDL